MSKKLQAGDKVLCRYYNMPDGCFYGVPFRATIVRKQTGLEIFESVHPVREFVVTRESDGAQISVWRKEILHRIDS